jgi:calcineurin-like phosphoesterase family protein
MKINLSPGQNLYFTSDTHYGHSNICSATTKWENPEGNVRQFSSLEEMNSTIINNINSVIKPSDILFHLGDWSFGGFDKIEEFRNQINCKNIHIITGNHDHHIENNRGGCQLLFSSVNKYLNLNVKWNVGTPLVMEQRFTLMHFPIASWDNMSRGVIHLHGHVHLPKHLKLGEGRSLDVGVDGNDMKPYSLDGVMRLVKNQPIKKLVLPQDHHEITENYK